MDLTQLANLGEFIGGVAVLVTLVYLAVQVRSGTKTFKLSSFSSAKEQLNGVNMTIAAHPELGLLFTKGGASMDRLDVGERLRFELIGFSYFNIFERLFLESREKIGSGLWEVEEHTLVTFLSMPGFEQWWKENPVSFDPKFREHVNQILADDGRMGPTRARIRSYGSSRASS